MKITVLNDTYLKKSTTQSGKLSNQSGTLSFMPKNKVLEVEKVLEDKDGHLYLQLAYGLGNWWIYKPHFKIEEDTLFSFGTEGLQLLKHFEGLRLTAYLDAVNVLTIGYGSTGGHVQKGMQISEKEAEDLLKRDLVRFEKAVQDLVKVPLTEPQYDALVSLAFNIGTGAFASSTLLKKLNAKDYAGAANEILRWDKAGGRTLEGLTRRRVAERDLFLKGFSQQESNPVKLDIPYYSQRDNKRDPHQTCNVTCVAMCLAFYGVKASKSSIQLEDELDAVVEANGWNRYLHSDLVKLIKEYGCQSQFSTTMSWEKVKEHLSGGNPVILSGKFTNGGHIIVLRGFDNKGFFVNDPWGDHQPGGGYKVISGENLHYSYKKMYDVSYGGSASTWAHLISQNN